MAKKRDNLVRKLDESNPDVSVNHLDFLDISESCHSSASKFSQRVKENIRTKGTSKDSQAPRAEKPNKAKNFKLSWKANRVELKVRPKMMMKKRETLVEKVCQWLKYL